MSERDHQDHLFISYASEDGALAEWLSLRLTAEGYRIWCDRFQLLGGESYPRDIDRAIKERSFRMLGLVSRVSLAKPNPVKERTLALNIARERNVDFLIPLNVDGLRASELDWMQADLTYIPFHRSWAQGIAQLLKKLSAIGAPREAVHARRTAISEWYEAQRKITTRPERLWSNLLPVKELPGAIHRLRLNGQAPLLPNDWPVHRTDDGGWVFEVPPGVEDRIVESVGWDQGPRSEEPGWRVVANLLRQYVRGRCLRLGLVETTNGELYFPSALVAGDRLPFVSHTGRKAYVQTVGFKTFRSRDTTVKNRHHLAPTFIPRVDRFGAPFLELQLRVHLTDERGGPLPPRIINRRRKRITHYWFNHQWRTRVVAVANWFAEAQSEVNLARTPQLRILVGGHPLQLSAPVGIPEEPAATEDLDLEEPGLIELEDDAAGNGAVS